MSDPKKAQKHKFLE